MASIARIRVVLTGFQGAPGVSTFYSNYGATNPPVADLRTFYNAIAGQFASTVQIQVPGSGDTISDATGEIDGTWSVSPAPTVVNGSGSTTYPGPVGACVNWLTGSIINGRRLQGRTFLVPFGISSFDSAGSLTSAAVTAIQAAATTLVGATQPLRVWHRPTSPGATNGSSAAVTSARVPDLSAVLRSRRD